MKRAICPSCGAPVLFHSAASIYAVCEFCRSTLLRTGEDLKNLGRMADLLDDTSRIQIGSEGTFRSRHFLVVGRIQLKYEAGLWNEWHILFDDGRSAWLAEAAGEYIVSAQVSVREPIPAFTALVPEMPSPGNETLQLSESPHSQACSHICWMASSQSSPQPESRATPPSNTAPRTRRIDMAGR